MLVPRKKHLLWSVAVCSVISHVIALVLDVSRLNFSIVNVLTLVEMNVLGAFPFRIITFYSHLVGHWAGVAVFLALNLLKIESAMRPLLNFIFTDIQLIIYNAKIVFNKILVYVKVLNNELTKFNLWS
jgi:hypothetical protein